MYVRMYVDDEPTPALSMPRQKLAARGYDGWLKSEEGVLVRRSGCRRAGRGSRQAGIRASDSGKDRSTSGGNGRINPRALTVGRVSF